MLTDNLAKVQKIIKEFENAREEAQCSALVTPDLIHIALEVGKGAGVTGRDVEHALDIVTSKTQRVLDILRDTQKNGARGYGFVIEQADPTNHRNIVRYPSPRLVAICKRIDEILS